MRQVEGEYSADSRTFIPVSHGNADGPEPVKVILRSPTEAQRRAATRSLKWELKLDTEGVPVIGKDGKPDFDTDAESVDEWRRVLLTSCVVRVLQYKDAAGDPIDTGAKLWEHGEDSFIDEVSVEISEGLSTSKAQKKT